LQQEAAMIFANLLHLSYNMWGDWENPKMGPHWCARPYLRFEEKLWNELLEKMAAAGMNMVVIDLGDGVKYRSHPEIAVEHAWDVEKLQKEIERMKVMGLEAIPKMNFSTCHDQWLGEYSRMVSSKIYYKVCEDLIAEVIDIFNKPRFFHLGMDEEEIQHQEQFRHIVLRKHGLWWEDFEFLRHQVENRGVKSWIWSDYVWNHGPEFYERMPKSVVQSNWYREPVKGGAKSVYGGVFNESIECVKAYVDLDKAGYEQIPTVSNWETPENIYGTIKFCREKLSKDRLKGFFLTPWKPTLAVARDRHLDAIEHFGKAIREIA
jgi:hypothetical protein